jgi:hypothetical protein
MFSFDDILPRFNPNMVLLSPCMMEQRRGSLPERYRLVEEGGEALDGPFQTVSKSPR